MTPEKLYLAVYVPYNPLYQIWLRYLVYFSFQSAENRFRDARTPQPVEIVFNTMTYIEVVKQYKDRNTFSVVSLT